MQQALRILNRTTPTHRTALTRGIGKDPTMSRGKFEPCSTRLKPDGQLGARVVASHGGDHSQRGTAGEGLACVLAAAHTQSIQAPSTAQVEEAGQVPEARMNTPAVQLPTALPIPASPHYGVRPDQYPRQCGLIHGEAFRMPGTGPTIRKGG